MKIDLILTVEELEFLIASMEFCLDTLNEKLDEPDEYPRHVVIYMLNNCDSILKKLINLKKN